MPGQIVPKKVVVVGAGISGLTAARILSELGSEVHVYDTRSHVGGNCYDEPRHGCIAHVYGAHIFHTDDERVWSFLNRFTSFKAYRHKVMAETDFGLIQIPFRNVNETLSYHMVQQVTEGYSKKQWGIEYSDLPEEVKGRLKMRKVGESCDYFQDKYQGIPAHGYSYMFQEICKGLTVHTGVEENAWRAEQCDLVIFTGKIDSYFNYCHGKLGYRSLSFDWAYRVEPLPCAVVNDCREESPHTRCIDHGYWNGRARGLTVLSIETPVEHDDTNVPYYPKPFGDNPAMHEQYKKLAQDHEDTIFLGRLGTYSYLNMDQAVAQAMDVLEDRFILKEK